MRRTRTIGRVGGPVVLLVGLAASGAEAQDRTGPASVAPERRLSLEAAAGPQTKYVGSAVSIAFGFAPARRLTYVTGGVGRAISRPTVNELFPHPNERNIQVLYYGGGVRMPRGPRFDAFADARLILSTEAVSDYLGVRLPVRGGIAWRF
jgi:hypothetical protein